MTIREDLLQAVRTWFKANAAASALTDAQVIVADPSGASVRPGLPYVTVKVLSYDTIIGQDEVLHGASGSNPTAQVRGGRRFTVSIQGFGEAAADWLDCAALSLSREDVAQDLADAGLSLMPMAGSTNDADLLDTAFEPRSIREFEGEYQLTGDTATLIPLTSVEITQTQSADSAGDLDGSFTVNL